MVLIDMGSHVLITHAVRELEGVGEGGRAPDLEATLIALGLFLAGDRNATGMGVERDADGIGVEREGSANLDTAVDGGDGEARARGRGEGNEYA